MQKSKKVRMPAGIRNKLMAAVAMLLVSSIMMVSSTYAWFTLSTAPEVTGITTSVGANGNLEIALLNSKTYADMSTITSSVGDSSAVKNVDEANITWGNLVDLSDASYGLNLIALNPAALNSTTAEDGTITVGETLLMTAEYGADGRVSNLKDNTISGVYNTNGKWVTTENIGTADDPTVVTAHGVRAIGVDSNMSTAQIVFNAATSAVNSGSRGASAPVSSAVARNRGTFLTLAMSLGNAESTPANYTTQELDALKAVAEGVQASLNTAVKTYANAILAKLAVTEGVSDELLTTLRGQLSGITDAANLSTILSGTTGISVPADYTSSLSAIATAQGKVATVLGHFSGEGAYSEATPAATVKENVVTPLIGSTVVAYNAGGGTETPSMSTIGNIKEIYVTGGLVADVAVEAGTYEMCRVTEIYDVTIYAGAKDNTDNNLAEVAALVAGLTPPSGANAEQTIADFYGYIIDFAFRTNASGSSLQLQTAAANRVYSNAEGDNLATQGAGSTATFAFDSSVLKEEQVQTLLGAVRLVFLNPVTGAVHATATLAEVDVDGSEATAKVKLAGQTGDAAPIVALAQNTATAVSVLVYLDGNEVDNGDVANAASSGVLNLNLQFSSSAELIPMQNTALQQMTAYTVSFNANGGTGFMQAVKASGETYTVPATATFTRTGYTFKGWSTETAGTVIAAPITLEGDTTLYAIWEQNAQQPDVDEGEDDNTQQTPVATPMTAVNVEGANLSGNVTFTDKTITFKLTDGNNELNDTNGSVAVTVGDTNEEAAVSYAAGAWTATVEDTELAANTAVSITYTANT